MKKLLFFPLEGIWKYRPRQRWFWLEGRPYVVGMKDAELAQNTLMSAPVLF
jgi:hypothetical protein